ncbi:MAG TPA: class I SAM-dependent methyltransferase [Puia sp.]|nr:class I SAM-dependent methyltransferase [Puia sp.]
MEQNKSSATSLGVASLRAAHQVLDGEPKLLFDPVILRLLGSAFEEQLRQNADRFRSPASIGLRSHVLLRSRFAEDCLAAACNRGVRQYILLGAGLDTYAWRQPPELEELRIFEMDHPATQEQKKQMLDRAGLKTPANLFFTPIDFERTTIAEALREQPFDPDAPCFISWLGVMVYLSMEAIDAVFDWMISLPAGSEMVLTFTQKRENHLLSHRAAELGEPWQTFFTPEELKEKLIARGFSSVQILEPADAWRNYYSRRTDELPAPRHASIARVCK